MSHNMLRDELLELEGFDQSLKDKYQEAVNKMIERPHKPLERVWWLFWSFWGLLFMVGFGAAALLIGPDLPWQGRLGFGLGSIFGAIWMVLCISIVRKGSFHLKRDWLALSGITWVFLVLISFSAIVFSGFMTNTTKGILMVASNLTFLVTLGYIITWGHLRGIECHLKEHLLRLELQNITVSELITKDRKG